MIAAIIIILIAFIYLETSYQEFLKKSDNRIRKPFKNYNK